MKITLSQKHRNFIDFLFAMTQKEVKTRYRFAALGFLWVVLNPLLQMLVMGFVFQFFIPIKVENYFSFLFAGLLPWSFFSMTITKATPSIVFERALIQKAFFPRESIVLSILFSHLFHFCIALGLFMLVTILNQVIQGMHAGEILVYVLRLLTIIPLVVWLACFCSGVSLWLAALNVRYRDVNFIVQALLPLWFYATPILYVLELLPENIRMFFYLNPMTAVIELFQAILLNTSPLSWSAAVLSLLLSLLLSGWGWYYFYQSSKFFDDWV